MISDLIFQISNLSLPSRDIPPSAPWDKMPPARIDWFVQVDDHGD
jgi:hypothetical protein